jgi:multisubunit Na+/H+ antiporter MnhF subunit
MTEPLLILTLAALIISVLIGFHRLIVGPSALDRILAFDAVVICAVGLVVVLSRIWHTPVYLELILIVASLGFFTTVAFVYYYQHSDGPLEEREDAS